MIWRGIIDKQEFEHLFEEHLKSEEVLAYPKQHFLRTQFEYSGVTLREEDDI